jgi:hypothetical protein
VRLRLPDREPFDYQVARDNRQWPDHVLRMTITASLLSWLRPATVIDPACGDASIVITAHALNPMSGAFLSDISKPNFYRIGTELRPILPEDLFVSCQPLEESLASPGTFDAVVLTEILEHVEDPVEILKMARVRAAMLIASSPVFLDDRTLDPNPEHLWQFDAAGYQQMLVEAGWETFAFVPIHLTEFPYDFQLWAAR